MEGFDARTDELLEVLGRYEGQRLFTAILGSPDPDGLASAWALSFLAKHAGVRMDLLTFEVVSRPDNGAFVRLLDIPFKRVRLRLPRIKYAGFAVVDRQNARLPVPVKKGFKLVAHIDHHVKVRTGAMFSQQEPKAGSTASIMAHHFSNRTDVLIEDQEEACRVCTALMYGIRTDTGDFLNAEPFDFEAAALIEPWVSPELVRTIVRTPLGNHFLDALSSALKTARTENGFTVAFTGKVGRRNRDAIGQTADFMSRGEDTDTVVVFGSVAGTLVGSLRTADADLDSYHLLDSALSAVFGVPVDCGGRRFAGGFQIPPSLFLDADESKANELVFESLLSAWMNRKKRRRRRKRTRVKAR
ncbi:MAG: hypothetical protein ISR64_11550 [Deltaproteobacteria bacterium]|nr:hypothetical protein [Deltaproteobacteria bacterium]